VLHESCRNSAPARCRHAAQPFVPKGITDFSLAGCFTFSTVAQTRPVACSRLTTQPWFVGWVSAHADRRSLAPRRRDRQGEPNHRRKPVEPLSTRRPRRRRTEDRLGTAFQPQMNADERRDGRPEAAGHRPELIPFLLRTGNRQLSTGAQRQMNRDRPNPAFGRQPMRLALCGYQRGDCLARRRRTGREPGPSTKPVPPGTTEPLRRVPFLSPLRRLAVSPSPENGVLSPMSPAVGFGPTATGLQNRTLQILKPWRNQDLQHTAKKR